VIELRGVGRRFGAFEALRDATFDVAGGEIVALLGPNGAGKTTASRIIGGILAPTSGDALVNGISVRDDPNAVRARCGLVTDMPSLYERMTLRAYLHFFARLFHVEQAASRIGSLAALLGLADALDRRLGAYSRGMKQKAAIARALVHDPPVLLLDEPATALDPEMARTFRQLIVSLRAEHRAILLCTHDLDEAQRIADRVVILSRGRVVHAGPTAGLRTSERPRYVVQLRGSEAVALAALRGAGVEGERVGAVDGRVALRFAVADPERANPTVLRALLDAGLAVVSLVPEERSLEDAYFTIIREAQP
jgi:ABC-2 type transport system ATP-binding protein